MKKQKTRFEPMHPSGWDKSRLRKLLERELGRKVLVVGDVGVDRYTLGLVERISPEAPVPVVLVQEEQLKLGLAANVADNIQALGGTPWLVGIVGNDRGAQDFKKLLRSVGVSGGHLVTDRSRRTVLKDRVVSDRQQLLRIDHESAHAIERKVEDQVIEKVRALLPRADAVILEDYAKGLVSRRLAGEIFSLARRHRKMVSVDPNSKSPLELYKGAFVLTPNTREAESLSGVLIRDNESLVKAGREILRRTSADHVVITRGKEGMAIFSDGNSSVRLIPTYAREVYDVSGAGDTVISVLTLALAGGASIEDSAVLGNLAAGVEVGKRGTATVSRGEIEVALEFFGALS